MKIDPADTQYWIFGAILLVVVLAIGRTLSQRHRDPISGFNLDDLLLDPKTGKTSFARCLGMGGFTTMTFVVIYGTFTHTMSDAVFGLYVTGCFAPAIAKIYNDGGVEKAAAAPEQPATVIGNQVTMNGPQPGQ